MRAIVRQFVERSVGPADQLSIAYTSGAVRPFGSSRRSLLAMADAFTGRRLRSATLERLDQQDQATAADANDAYQVPTSELERGRLDRATIRHLSSQCEILESIRSRRKAIVWVSEGLEYDFTRSNGRVYSESILDELRRLQDRAARANVVVYSINPGGLESVSDDLVQVGSGPSGVPTVGVNNSIYVPDAAFAPEDAFLGTASLLSDQALATRSLRQLPALTGGVAIANRGELQGALDRILDEVSNFYLLGFVPSEGADSEPRENRLEVRVRRPGTTVRARTGYGTPPGDPADRTHLGSGSSRELRDALSLPIPTTGLPLRVVSAPMGQDGDEAEVIVVVSTAVDAFRFEERRGEIQDEVEVWVGAVDRDGRLVDSHAQRVELKLPAELRERIAADGFRAGAALRLRPGRYQLRAAVRELGAGQIGTVVTELLVPEVDDSFLRGLSLTSEREAGVPVAGFDHLDSALPVAPATSRSFDRGDALIAFLEVTADADEDFELLLEVRDGFDDAIVSQMGGPAPPRKDGEVLMLSKRVPLSRLSPGEYRLVFRALSDEGETLSERSDRFSVR